MRYAIYYTPEPGDPLLRAAEAWLGRSAFGHATAGDAPAEADLVRDARRYGFHATLKAPFELTSGHDEAELAAALARWAAKREPVGNVRLKLAQPSGFFALVPDGPHGELDAFAAELVRGFEPFRRPLSAADRARRRPEELTERQRAHLDNFGYPYVFDDFQFHMTLTGRLDPQRSAAIRPELERRFEPLLAHPHTIATVALFREEAPGADFTVAGHVPLEGRVRHSQTAFGSFDAA